MTEERVARDAEVLDFFDKPELKPVTEIAPVTVAVTKPPAPKKDRGLNGSGASSQRKSGPGS